MLPASLSPIALHVFVCLFVCNSFWCFWAAWCAQLEKQRIEMQVQRRLGDEVTMRLQPEQVSSLLEERGRLVKEMARLEEVLAMEQHNENAAAAVAARASHK